MVFFFFHVRKDGTDARVGESVAGGVCCLHKVGSGLVTVVPMGHAADEGILIRLFREIRKPLAELDSRDIRGEEFLHRPVVVVSGVRFRIPGVGMRHPAPEEDLDHGGGLCARDDFSSRFWGSWSWIHRRGRGWRGTHDLISEETNGAEESDLHRTATVDGPSQAHAQLIAMDGQRFEVGDIVFHGVGMSGDASISGGRRIRGC